MNQSQNNLWVNFFNRPVLWGWAAGTILIMVMIETLILSSPTITDLSTGGTTLIGSRPDFITLYLAPFGAKFITTLPGIFGLGSETSIVRIQSSLISVIIIMIICFMVAILFTKRTQSGIYILGPFWVYSVIIILFYNYVTSIAETETLVGNSNITFVWLPTFFSLVFWSAIAGILAKMLAVILMKSGWIEGLDEAGGGQLMKFTPPAALATVGATIMESMKPIPSDTSLGNTESQQVLRIGHSATTCPYCGRSDKLKKKKGKGYNGCTCTACDSIDFGVLPQKGNTGKTCSECGAGILRNTRFCWNCGAFFENQQNNVSQLEQEQPAEIGVGETKERGFCPNCGVKVPTSDKFCKNCGYKLNSEEF